MITEDYCSYELSKLLKEKRFDEPCFSYYKNDKSVHWFEYRMRNSQTLGRYIMRPYYGLAMKWLREVHKIDIFIDTDFPIDRMKYTYKIVRIYKDGDKYTDVMGGSFDTYEEAVEAALKYTLENLV